MQVGFLWKSLSENNKATNNQQTINGPIKTIRDEQKLDYRSTLYCILYFHVFSMCQCVSNRIFEVPYRYSVQGKAKLALRSAAFGTWLSVTSEGATWQNTAAILLGFSQRIGGLFCARTGLIYGCW